MAIILGTSGDDVLRGSSGDDDLIGGWNRDILTGGSGADTFHFSTGDGGSGPAADIIRDFSLEDGDEIQLNFTGTTELIGVHSSPGAYEVSYLHEDGNTLVRFHAGNWQGSYGLTLYNEIVLEDVEVHLTDEDFVFLG